MLYESIFVPEGKKRPDRSIIALPSISRYLEGWGKAEDFGFIAVTHLNEPVGSITARKFNAINKGYGYVDDETPEMGMAVQPEHRGRGVGTLLIRMLLKEAKIKGVRAISLSVDAFNPAIQLYKRHGFQEVAVEGTAVTMKMEL
jgi:GNAT superfamily N-acetyltransferase